ncbi:ATP-dependent RNA-DNA and DNA-DNA helicase protein [Rhizobium phage RHph_I1_18]|nr:ATP-dependent RNA-DNA and DNA-DNA helicase protein [Rhizobium phage RHph_I1_18]
MADINVVHYNETFVRIVAERPYLKEIHKEFSFFAKNYQFHPKYKSKMWDGRISLFRAGERFLPKGLLARLNEWAEHNRRTIAFDPDVLATLSPFSVDNNDIIEFYKRIGGPFEPLDTQIDAVSHCINEGRCVILAPTSNGKSYMIHGLAAFFALQKKRVLIIVDRSQLVQQLKENIAEEYFGAAKFNTGMVYDKDLDISKLDVYLTTWQSCYENDEEWFQQFDVFIGDELHKFKAKSLQTINEKIGHISWRFGFTGTLDNDSVTDRLTIIGMFGPAHRVATIKELIEAGISARPTIHMIRIIYPESDRKALGQADYPSESAFLEGHEKRNQIIHNAILATKGNRLVAFKSDTHGKLLRDRLISEGHKPFFANYTVKREKRVEISKIIDTMRDAIGVVSIGTFSTGINIKLIDTLIITCLLKSKITVPQLIGRTLRVTQSKKTSEILDFGDDLSQDLKGGDVYENMSLRHFNARKKIYQSEGFLVKEKVIDLTK